MCGPTPEAPGPSRVVGIGACAFEQRAGAKCMVTDDDLLMTATRPAPNDGVFMMYASIEDYPRASAREHVQVVVGMENAQGLFRWATDRAHVTVGPGQAFITFEETALKAVPPLKADDVVVSGTFTCASIVDVSDAERR